MSTTTLMPAHAATPPRRAWLAAVAWAAGWAAMLALDGSFDLANLALLLVLTSALASLWLPGMLSMLAGAAGVLAFNWTFVPPRHSFDVDIRQHALLLAAMLGVNLIVSALMLRRRRAAEGAQAHAARETSLRLFSDALRDADAPELHAGRLHLALADASGVPVALRLRLAAEVPPEDDAQLLQLGEPDADQRAGMALAMREARPLGPGSGRYEQQPDLYLPLRSRGPAMGAAVLRGLGHRADAGMVAHAQALCDQLGLALHRQAAARETLVARDEAQSQATRNALLAAIAHDFRTPLATIMSAASSLEQQADRMDVAQRRRLAAGIVDEAARLARMADNTLQLARLDAPGVQLRCDWESAEDLVGAVVGRLRVRDTDRRLRARTEPGLPLLWCDAMLMAQLLENLADNALKYSPRESPVEILARRQDEQIVLAVRDRGPGVAPAWRERVFEVFARGAEPVAGQSAPPPTRGAGVGLAVCRAIARAHGGQMVLRARAHGGSSFECRLPLREAPDAPPGDPPPEAA